MSQPDTHGNKTKWTDLMDQYGALTEAQGYCTKLFEDASKEFRVVHAEVKAKELVVENAKAAVVKLSSTHFAAYKDHKKDKVDDAKKEVYEKAREAFAGGSHLDKKLKRHERQLAMDEGDQSVVEKRRWDTFLSLAKISSKRDQLLKDALLLELELENKEELHEAANDLLVDDPAADQGEAKRTRTSAAATP